MSGLSINKRGDKRGDKRGLSTIIATLLIVLLTLVLAGMVWGIVSNLVQNRLEESSSCLEVFGKINLDDQYTCYNATSKEFRFSISQEDVFLEDALILISVEGQTKSLYIGEKNRTVTNLRPFGGNYGGNVSLPGRNAGLTYVYNITGAGFSSKPDKVEIAPIAKDKQCDKSDSLVEIDVCF